MDLSHILSIYIIDKVKEKLKSNYDIIDETSIDLIVNKYIKIADIDKIIDFDILEESKDQCSARVWRKSIIVNDKIYNFKKTDSRCSFKGTEVFNGYCYCKKHMNQLKSKGYLRLLRYDQECPKKDIIGYENNEYIYGSDRIWYMNYRDQLEIILRYHNNLLDKLVDQGGS